MACSKSTQLGILPPTSEFTNFLAYQNNLLFYSQPQCTKGFSWPHVPFTPFRCIAVEMAARQHTFWVKCFVRNQLSRLTKQKHLQPPLFKVKSCPGSPKSGNASLEVTIMTPCGRKKDPLERHAIFNDCPEFVETASHFAVIG